MRVKGWEPVVYKSSSLQRCVSKVLKRCSWSWIAFEALRFEGLPKGLQSLSREREREREANQSKPEPAESIQRPKQACFVLTALMTRPELLAWTRASSLSVRCFAIVSILALLRCTARNV